MTNALAVSRRGRRSGAYDFDGVAPQKYQNNVLAVEMQQIEREIHQLGRRIPMPLRGAVREKRAELAV